MKIKYFKGEEGLTIGRAEYDNCYYVPGVSQFVVLAVSNMCTSKERKQLLNVEPFVAFSKPHGSDEFNEKTGKEVVKNKLLIRDAERNILKISIVEKYLNKVLSGVNYNCTKYTNRMNNSYANLEKFE